MNFSPENITENMTVLKESTQVKSWHVYNSNVLVKSSKVQQTKTLAFLPILGFIIFIICSLLKVYKWSRDSARWKARGEVEFGDEAEVNYGIIKAGDKDFCQIDILSDGASVYDTVNSLRFFSNGYATQMSDSYPYHDTITSYKSLLIHKADGSQNGSVKSNKAFVQKGTQSKDVTVPESYPVRSKNIGHSSAMEGERSEIATRSTSTMLLKRQLSKDSQLLHFESKKSRRRRASGDVSARRRSELHPPSHLVSNPICSLPSVRHTFSFSGDSREDILHNLRVDRKTFVGKNKKMLQSGGRMLSFPGSSCHSAPCTHNHNGAVNIPRRRRHFSADSVRYLKKATINNINHKYFCEEDLATFSMAAGIKMIMETNPFSVQVTRPSEHPKTSHSLDVGAPFVSGPDLDIRRKKDIPLSMVSSGQILDCSMLHSLNSGAMIHSMPEITETSRRHSISETKILISHAREEFFKNKLNNAFSLKPKDTINTHQSGAVVGYRDSKNSPKTKVTPADCSQISNSEGHSLCVEDKINLNLQRVQWPSLGSPSKSTCVNKKRNIPSLRKQQNSDLVETNTSENINDGVVEPANKCNLYKVQRFQVTYVNAKISSHISDGAKTS